MSDVTQPINDNYTPDISNVYFEVPTASERHQTVKIEEHKDGYWMSGIVLKLKYQKNRGNLSVLIWQRNRAANLVGFRFTKKGDVVGECFIPKQGLTKEEFDFCKDKLARECDRMEFLLTGEDRE